MRNDHWLENQLNDIWQKHFSDVTKINNVVIKFGRNARTRLGSIKQARCSKFEVRSSKEFASQIIISGYFRNERVPEYIIDLTIAHELCHYAHGFSSPHPQLLKHPHRGGVVDIELKKRGFGEKLKMQKKWLKEEWPKIVKRSKIKIKNYSPKSENAFLRFFLDF